MRRRFRLKKNLKNIYLDIDGVILTRGVTPALHLDKFLSYVLDKYSVYWLTSKYRGDNKQIVKYLSQFLLPDVMPLINQIGQTNFTLDKTEAIDFDREFYWLDDELFDSEKNFLKARSVYDSWIQLNLIDNPNQLLSLINGKLGDYK